jgi:hypothetical protein
MLVWLTASHVLLPSTQAASFLVLRGHLFLIRLTIRVWPEHYNISLSLGLTSLILFSKYDPREPHYTLIKRILRYLHGTLNHGLQLCPTDVSTLVAYSDADWASCPDTRRSTSGYAVFLGDNLVSWSSKRQPTVSRSSAEAEYRAVANAVAETTWLRQLLQEMHIPLKRATIVFCDNVSVVYLSSNPVNHQRTKHIEIDLYFVQE